MANPDGSPPNYPIVDDDGYKLYNNFILTPGGTAIVATNPAAKSPKPESDPGWEERKAKAKRARTDECEAKRSTRKGAVLFGTPDSSQPADLEISDDDDL